MLQNKGQGLWYFILLHPLSLFYEPQLVPVFFPTDKVMYSFPSIQTSSALSFIQVRFSYKPFSAKLIHQSFKGRIQELLKMF